LSAAFASQRAGDPGECKQPNEYKRVPTDEAPSDTTQINRRVRRQLYAIRSRPDQLQSFLKSFSLPFD
jgi:hypothetical protein